MYFVIIYENRRMKLVEIVLRGEWENVRGVKSKIYCKAIYKNHHVFPLCRLYAKN
jgi:hypothetical protein